MQLVETLITPEICHYMIYFPSPQCKGVLPHICFKCNLRHPSCMFSFGNGSCELLYLNHKKGKSTCMIIP